MTRIGMYNDIVRKFGAGSFDAKMFYKAMEQEDVPRRSLEQLYKAIMKKQQGS